MTVQRLPWLLPALVGAVLVTLLVGTLATRVAYPYDLEWMEGGMLAHGWRVQRGLPLYPAPSPDWVPYIYPPGYAFLLAATGTTYAAGRVISLLGTAMAALSVVWIVGRHGRGTHRWHAGVMAAVVLIGTWDAGGTFLDLVRPDGLALGLLMASLALGFERHRSAQVVGGLLLAAAFLVKHHAAAWGLPIAIGLWARDGDLRAALRYGLAALLPATLAIAVLHATTGGHLLTYLLVVPASHEVRWSRAFPGIPWELGSALPFAVSVTGLWAVWRAIALLPARARGPAVAAVAVLTLVMAVGFTLVSPNLPPPGSERMLRALARNLGVGLPNTHGSHVAGPIVASVGIGGCTLLVLAPLIAAIARALGRPVERGWVAASAIGAVSLIVVGWMRGHVGGFVNVDIPLFAMIAVGLGLATADLSSRPWLRGWLGPSLAAVLVAAQLGTQLRTTDLDRRTPTAVDRATGDAIVARLRSMEGPIWSPIAPWLPVQAGHDPSAHLIAIWDVGNHPGGPWPETRAAFRNAVRDGRWRVVLDGKQGLRFGVQEYTARTADLPGDPRAFRPRTGWRDRPVTIRTWVTESATGGGVDGRAPERTE